MHRSTCLEAVLWVAFIMVVSTAIACSDDEVGAFELPPEEVVQDSTSDLGEVGPPPSGPNIIFTTAESYEGNLGGLAGADAICMAEASAAGLEGRFIAWLSDHTVSAYTRVAETGAQGWVRPDGKPVAADLDAWEAGEIWYPVSLDAAATALGGHPDSVWVGFYRESPFDQSSSNCGAWTGTAAGTSAIGFVHSGGESHHKTKWQGQCSSDSRLRCMQVDHDTEVEAPAAQTGRLAFVSTQAFNPATGTANADAVCAADATQAGLAGSFLALLPEAPTSALGRFDVDGQPWVRLDGLPLVAEAIDWSHSRLEVPVKFLADGTVWGEVKAVKSGNLIATGNIHVDTLIGRNNCNNWTHAPNDTFSSRPDIGGPSWFGSSFLLACDQLVRVYCLQE